MPRASWKGRTAGKQLAFKTFFPQKIEDTNFSQPFTLLCHASSNSAPYRVHEAIALTCFHTDNWVLLLKQHLQPLGYLGTMPRALFAGMFSVRFFQTMTRWREKSICPSHCSVWSAGRLCEESRFLHRANPIRLTVCASRFCCTRSWSGYQEMLEWIPANTREQEPKKGRKGTRTKATQGGYEGPVVTQFQIGRIENGLGESTASGTDAGTITYLRNLTFGPSSNTRSKMQTKPPRSKSGSKPSLVRPDRSHLTHGRDIIRGDLLSPYFYF